jgi:hypothetical protein
VQAKRTSLELLLPLYRSEALCVHAVHTYLRSGTQDPQELLIEANRPRRQNATLSLEPSQLQVSVLRYNYLLNIPDADPQPRGCKNQVGV